MNRIILGLILLIAIILLFFWKIGLFGLWTGGISFISSDAEVYTNQEGNIIEGEFPISIDLSNLESNIGKDLYNDGIHRIYVSSLRNTGSVDTGGYTIGFRAIGQYSLTGASIISGVHHVSAEENPLPYYLSAKMKAEYNNKVYNSSESWLSGINYKDGDDFGFYIFPSEAYEKNAVSLNEKGIVNITITGLYKNIWSKK